MLLYDLCAMVSASFCSLPSPCIIVLLLATEQNSTLESHVVPEPKLELYCLVKGEDVNSVFLVRINVSEHVYDLKKAIQQERKGLFGKISAVKLMLWKTLIPIDGSFNQAILDANFTHEDCLLAVSLSRIFPVLPPPRHVHIIVKGQHPCLFVKHNLTMEPVFALCLS